MWWLDLEPTCTLCKERMIPLEVKVHRTPRRELPQGRAVCRYRPGRAQGRGQRPGPSLLPSSREGDVEEYKKNEL